MDEAPPRARRWRWVVGIGLIVAGLGGITAWAIASPGAMSYYRTPSQIIAKETPATGQTTLRVGGRVAKGTLERDGGRVSFSVTDGRHEVGVRYHGDVPDTLKEGTDVVAEGAISRDGTLMATRVMAKCSSKFEPKDARKRYSGTT